MIIATGLFSFVAVVFLSGGRDPFWNSVAVGGLMVLFWLFEVVPIYVTALFPFVFGIPLGVLDSADLTSSYGHKYIYLFFGGFVLSLALEKWNVHQQIADRILHLVGNSKSRILLGFLLSTGLLSMWISNTATALMMLPMATAVISNLETDKKARFPIFLLLSVAYGASIGGMATLVGSPPNIQMAGILEETYHIHIDFFSWMKIGLPVSLLMLITTYVFFYFLLGKERKGKLHEVVNAKSNWTKNQKRVLMLFFAIVVLWAFRTPLYAWSGISYTDEGVAVLGAILLFFLPGEERKPLLEWKDTRKVSWGILLLFGGGMALANMLSRNGVIEKLAGVFEKFSYAPLIVLLAVLVVIAIYGTELMSNLALVAVFIPVVAEFALQTDYSILQLCMPIALASSCAFMLPVGTPPNAIVFSSGHLKVSDMAKSGFLLNLFAVVLIVLFSYIFL